MGTRNLTVVVVDGAHRIAQYCQWDGYPRGQGITVLKFLRTADLDKLASRCRQTAWISKEEHQALWASVGADNSGMVGLDIADKFKKKWPELDRDMGAEILAHVCAAEPGIKLDDQLYFAGDGLFCEWAYVIDLDAGTLEVFSGFNKDPLDPTERFASVERGPNDYTPVKLRKAYKLSDLPSDEVFLQDCEEEGDA